MSEGGIPSSNDDAPARNPYRAPSYFEQPSATAELDAWQRLEAAHTLPKFRGCCTALGVILLIVGTLNSGAAAYMVGMLATRPPMNPFGYAFAALFAVTIAAHFVFGVGALCRQVWAAWGAAALGGLRFAVDLIFSDFDVVSAAISIVVIVLALTIVRFARRLKAAGVPLRTKLQRGMISDRSVWNP